MKKAIALFVVVVVLFCVPGAAFAAKDVQADILSDAVMSPMYVYISNASCTMSISASGYADMDAYINSNSPTDKIHISEYLQRYVDGSWQTVASWSQNYYSTSASWTKGYYVSSGYDYRLYCYFYCYYGDYLLESTTRAAYDTY